MMRCAVGIVQDVENKILISKRPAHKMGGGFWEFPGGKIEENETAQQALIRELQEEVGLTPTLFKEFMQFSHTYLSHTVALEIFLIQEFKGIAKGLENQIIEWVQPCELPNYKFLEANTAIIERLL